MSIVVGVHSRDGIVIGADSKWTNTITNTSGHDAHKLFIVRKCNVGICHVGGTHPGGQKLRDFIIDALTATSSLNTLADVTIALYKALSLKDNQNHNKDMPLFIVCGYDGNEPCVFDVTREKIIHIKSSIIWNGETDPIDKLNMAGLLQDDMNRTLQNAEKICQDLISHTITNTSGKCGAPEEYITVKPNGIVVGYSKDLKIMEIIL